MEATPSTTARRAAAVHPTTTRATNPRPTTPATTPRGASGGGDRLTTDPADRRKRANAALLELVVTQATRRR